MIERTHARKIVAYPFIITSFRLSTRDENQNIRFGRHRRHTVAMEQLAGYRGGQSGEGRACAAGDIHREHLGCIPTAGRGCLTVACLREDLRREVGSEGRRVWVLVGCVSLERFMCNASRSSYAKDEEKRREAATGDRNLWVQ